jgi:hypothetical protein
MEEGFSNQKVSEKHSKDWAVWGAERVFLWAGGSGGYKQEFLAILDWRLMAIELL